MLAAVLALSIATGPVVSASIGASMPAPLVAIPDEPGAEMITQTTLVQAVAADLDSDGSREIVMLAGEDDGGLTAEAWRDGAEGWQRLGDPMQVVPPGDDGLASWEGTPARLIVRRAAGTDHVTLVRQPSVRDPYGVHPCCLLLDDLVLGPDGLQLVEVAARADAVDAVRVLDLDGDGTDELVASRSLLPLGDISYPTDMYVHRWTADRFAVTVQQLTIGSGDTPFLLGDTDGRPGDELGIAATAGRAALYRISLADDGTLAVDDAGTAARAAIAVPLGDDRGVAVLHTTGILAVHAWPAGEALGPPIGSVAMENGTLLGVVADEGTPSVVVDRTVVGERLHIRGLPDLAAQPSSSLPPSAAASAVAIGAVQPYSGPIPGGDADGEPILVAAGWLLGAGPEPTPFGPLAGAQPIGLVGAGGDQLALLHGSAMASGLDPAGGRMDAVAPMPGAAISVVPFALARALGPGIDDGRFDPPLTGTVEGGRPSEILVGRAGFAARIVAPVGSRMYLDGIGSSTPSILSIPASGHALVSIAAPEAADAGEATRVTLTVTTPAGQSYLARWHVRLADGPPPLAAAAHTRLGAGDVDVSGEAPVHASVTVDGAPVAVDADGHFVAHVALPPWPTDVVVTATDPLGNSATRTVSGVGWLDYRLLPWVAIAALALAAAAVALFLRVPRPEPAETPRAGDDDAALEELEAD